MEHNILPDLIVFSFDSTSYNPRPSILGLTPNSSEKCQNDFRVLCFFTIKDWLGGIGIFSVNLSGVDTTSVTIMSLFCCKSSHLPEDFYILLIFPDIFVHTFHSYFIIDQIQW